MRISLSSIVLFLVGCVGLFILTSYLISQHSLATFDEYMASTSQPAATTSNDWSPAPVEPLAFAGVPARLLATSSVRLKLPKGFLNLAISTTTPEQEQGLSGRGRLSEDEGMLFVFPEDSSYAFWMKDMLFSLDMVWIDASSTVIGVTSDLSPASYPATFAPPAPVRYVIEVDAGAAAKLGLTVGTKLPL